MQGGAAARLCLAVAVLSGATAARADDGDALFRAPGAPPRTAIVEPIGPGVESQYFFLHDDNYFALLGNGGWPPQAKFQVSIRFEIVSIGNWNNFGLSFAYTQKTFMDLLDFHHSAPLVETDYHPEGFLSYRPRKLERFREFQLGVQHESDGLGVVDGVNQVPNSRGWSSVFVDGRWGIFRARPNDRTWLFLTPGLRVWYPFAVEPPDLIGSIGYFYAYLDLDLRIPQFPRASRISARVKVYEHSVEGDFYYPLLPLLSRGQIHAWLFLQLFRGQAERLIPYYETVTHIYGGIGFQ